MNAAAAEPVQAVPLLAVAAPTQAAHEVRNPADHSEVVGSAAFVEASAVPEIIAAAKAAAAPSAA